MTDTSTPTKEDIDAYNDAVLIRYKYGGAFSVNLNNVKSQPFYQWAKNNIQIKYGIDLYCQKQLEIHKEVIELAKRYHSVDIYKLTLDEGRESHDWLKPDHVINWVNPFLAGRYAYEHNIEKIIASYKRLFRSPYEVDYKTIIETLDEQINTKNSGDSSKTAIFIISAIAAIAGDYFRLITNPTLYESKIISAKYNKSTFELASKLQDRLTKYYDTDIQSQAGRLVRELDKLRNSLNEKPISIYGKSADINLPERFFVKSLASYFQLTTGSKQPTAILKISGAFFPINERQIYRLLEDKPDT